MPTYLYVTLAGDDLVAIYDLDPASGALSGRREFALPGGPSPLAIDPTKRYMYIGLRASKEIASLRIDPATGGLTLMGRVPLESDPCYVSTDRRGAYLLSAYFAGGLVAVHPISPDGIVHGPPIEWRPTRRHAHCVMTDRSNRFVLLPHIFPSNAIYQFLFDENTGKLTPNDPPCFEPAEPVGPRHYVYHPALDLVYAINEQGGSVTAYHFDPEQGTVAPFQTLSTLPDDFTGRNTCAQIHLTPDGRFLYGANRGHDSIACYATDPDTGALTIVARQPTEKTPRAFNVDPGGRFLYVSGLDSGRLASYRIAQESGALEPLAVYPLGTRPMWVEALVL